MGLDFVELVMAVEERFKIHVSNEEGESLRTVGDLYRLVLSKLEPSPFPPQRCLTSTAFYRTRRGLRDTLGLERRAIRPSTPLAPLLPWAQRRRIWEKLQSSIGLRLPGLRYPGAAWIGLLGAGLATSILIFRGLSVDFADSRVLGALWLLALSTAGLLRWITMPLAVGLPVGLTTVGDLARGVMHLNYAPLLDRNDERSQKRVWETLCAVMVEQPGVPSELIQPDALIVDHLGID